MVPISRVHGGGLHENGTICPFGIFPLFYSHLVQFEANPCDEAKCCLAGASGFRILLHSTVYEWIFGRRVLSTQPKTLSNTKES